MPALGRRLSLTIAVASAVVTALAHPARASATDAVCLDAPFTASTLDAVMAAGTEIGSWQAGDGSVPVALPDGRLLFLFGDSFVAGEFVHNSMLLVDGNCVTDLWRGKDRHTTPQTTFSPHAYGTYYWPADGYVHDGRLFVGLEEITATGSGLFDFEDVDFDYAVVDLRDGVTAAAFDHPTIIEDGPWDSSPLGRLSVVHVDSEPSIVNFRVLGTPGYYGSYLARFSDLSDPSTPWRWWDGSGWQDDPRLIADIAPDIEFFDSRIINPVEHGSAWWAATWGMGIGASMALLSAPQVTGPWTVLERHPTEGLEYLHGLFELRGALVLRWSNNTTEPTASWSELRPSFTALTAH